MQHFVGLFLVMLLVCWDKFGMICLGRIKNLNAMPLSLDQKLIDLLCNTCTICLSQLMLLGCVLNVITRVCVLGQMLCKKGCWHCAEQLPCMRLASRRGWRDQDLRRSPNPRVPRIVFVLSRTPTFGTAGRESKGPSGGRSRCARSQQDVRRSAVRSLCCCWCRRAG